MDDEKLIEAVKAHPCLYNIRIADYKVLLKKENAWMAVQEAVGAGQSVQDCMKRFKTIRDRFTRENKLHKKKSGDPGDSPPKWALFDMLMFLKDFVKHRQTCGNFVKEEEPQDPEPAAASLQPTQAPGPSDEQKELKPCPAKKKRKVEEVIDLDKVLMKELMSTKDDDEDGLFGATVAASLRKMDKKKKMLARIKILQCIYEAECGVPSVPPAPLPRDHYSYQPWHPQPMTPSTPSSPASNFECLQ